MKALKFICMPGAFLVLTSLSVLCAQQEGKISEFTENEAAFSGCEVGDSECHNKAMARFLMENLRYPKEAKEEGVGGKYMCNSLLERTDL